MAAANFQHRYFINVNPHEVYSYLADPKSYVGLSPLVTEVSEAVTGQNADGHTTIHYEAVETFTFAGFIRYPNRIKVMIELTRPAEQMINWVESIPNVRLKFVFNFQPEGNGTWIHEDVTAHMPLLLKGFVVSQAQSVQRSRGQILKQRMENR